MCLHFVLSGRRAQFGPLLQDVETFTSCSFTNKFFPLLNPFPPTPNGRDERQWNDDLWDCYFYDKCLKTFAESCFFFASGEDSSRRGSVFNSPQASSWFNQMTSFDCHARTSSDDSSSWRHIYIIYVSLTNISITNRYFDKSCLLFMWVLDAS